MAAAEMRKCLVNPLENTYYYSYQYGKIYHTKIDWKGEEHVNYSISRPCTPYSGFI